MDDKILHNLGRVLSEFMMGPIQLWILSRGIVLAIFMPSVPVVVVSAQRSAFNPLLYP